MDGFITFISSVGFPIAVAVYLLIFMKQSLDKLTNTLNLIRDSYAILQANQAKIIENLTKLAAAKKE